MLNPKSIIKWVKANFDYKQRKSGRKLELRICNPFQEREFGTRDTKYHFNISPYKGVVHDWRPNHRSHDGSFIKFVMDYLQCSKHEAIKSVVNASGSLAGILSEDEDDEEERPLVESVDLELPKPCWKLGEGPDKLERMAVNYLKSRCLTKQEIIDWGIMYGVGKVIFPYIEYGEVVYWQSRDIDDKLFLFPDDNVGVGKTDFLWGWHRVEYNEDVFITESLFGATSAGPGGLASGGADLDPKQIDRLEALSAKREILAPDNDDAGLASLANNRKRMLDRKDRLWYVIPPYIEDHEGNTIKDWNELDQICTFHPELAAKQLGDEAEEMGHKYTRYYMENYAQPFTLSEEINIRKRIRKKDPSRNKLRKVLE